MTTSALDLPELLRPAIEKYRDEAESLGRLPEELVTDLRERGAFRLYTPRDLGGFEAPPAVVFDVLARVARIDGPTAWIMWNLNMGFVAGVLGPEQVRTIWAPGLDPMIANSGQPGRMTPAEGGIFLSGHWKIVSGSHLSDWFLLAAVREASEDGTEDAAAGWGAGLYFCVVPSSAVQIQDTWHVAGMSGTDSNSVHAENLFVPAEMVFGFFEPIRLDGPAYRLPLVNLVFPGCAAVLIGMAQAAIDELVQLARTKVNVMGGALATQESVQVAVGRATAQVAAARGLLLSTAGELDRTTAAGRETTDEQRAAVRGAISLVTETARTVLAAMYAAGGSDPLYTSNRLGRIFRDGMAAAQSANLSTTQWALPGRILLGQPAEVPFI